jgi:hypothetical protein
MIEIPEGDAKAGLWLGDDGSVLGSDTAPGKYGSLGLAAWNEEIMVGIGVVRRDKGPS